MKKELIATDSFYWIASSRDSSQSQMMERRHCEQSEAIQRGTG